MAALPTPAHRTKAGQFTPKLFSVLREGYGAAEFRADIIAGLTVAVIALPLAMALGIASGTSPDRGLVTAVIAGFLISMLGGSRVQIGGPTGAFVVVVFNVIAQHGYDGLLIATIMAGIILVVAGYAGAGRVIRYIPYPVITGFTAGIAVIIATSQLRDLLGLEIAEMPGGFIDQLRVYWGAISTIHPVTLALGLGSLAFIIALRRWAPRLPVFLVAIVAATLLVSLFGLPVETIGARFPDMGGGFPAPSWPEMSPERLTELAPAAFTIAFLAGIESLLSAVVADGMTGFRHRSNQELVGQGVANIGSALFGGMPATGAIARTAANIRAGGRSPVAGMSHALFLLAAMLFAGDLMRAVPMAVLAAILIMVAWGMSEARRFLVLLRMPLGERTVLVATFLLTLLVDLTFAIGVGVTLSSLLFMARMSETAGTRRLGDEPEDASQRERLPAGVEILTIEGPFFFGVAGTLVEALKRIGARPKTIILRLDRVPYLDSSGAIAVEEFLKEAERGGIRIILSGVRPELLPTLQPLFEGDGGAGPIWATDDEEALRMAEAKPPPS